MSKLNIAVLFGGKSAERGVSIATGLEVVKHLNHTKYSVFPIELTKKGAFWIYKTLKTTDYPKLLKKLRIDLVFLALHGPLGEDGTIQGLLEQIGMPYTGSKVLASGLGMDKLASRKIFASEGLKVPIYIVHRKGETLNNGTLKWPVFVQPNNQGSAIGATIARSRIELRNSLELAHRYSDIALIDEFIKGTEITCAILGNSNPTVLPIIEIVTKHEFFDYEAKYNPSLVDEICPARISESLSKKAKKAAQVAYDSLGCWAYGRVDMIIRGNNLYVLEVNTLPGLTSVSLFPKAAKTVGMSYSQLLDKIIHYSKNDR